LISSGATSLQNLAGGSGAAADAPVLAGFLRGYRYAFLIAAALAFTGALVSLWPARRDEFRGT
jgi:predicted MFS family arabinose efflux permease